MYRYNGLYDTSCTNNGVNFLGNAPEIISSAPYESSLVFPSTLVLPDVKFPGNNNKFESVRGAALLSPTILKSEDVVTEHDNFNSIGNNYYNNNGVYDELSPNNQRPSLSNLLQRSMSCCSSTSGGYNSSSFPNQENGFLHHYPNYSSMTTSIQECDNRDIMKKVGRYNAEERKERIERYRSKRNQRNFTKKIKYACRKTLADNRPRVRGRFMRNEEPEEPNEICFGSQTDQVDAEYWNNKNYQQIHGGNVEHGEEDDDVWTNLLESLSVSNNPYFPC